MCWRTYFLRRMKSQTKGTHYNIYACARKKTTEGWKKIRRYGRALYDTRVLTCMTPGSRHVRHPGVRHKKKANRTNDTGRKQYGHIQGKKIQTEKVNTILKNISVHCFCTANQSSFFWTAYYTFFQRLFACIPIDKKIPPYTPFFLFTLFNLRVTNLIGHLLYYIFSFLGFFLYNETEP